MVGANAPDLLPEFLAWSAGEPAIVAVVLFGSRVRESVGRSDAWSDIDLQVVTTKPAVFKSREWTKFAAGRELLAHAVRPASGGVTKVTAMFRPGHEIDVVVVPAIKLRAARFAVSLGLHRRVPALARGLNELATVMRGSHRVLKGGRGWEDFYARVVADVRGTRLDTTEALALAEEFFCDWHWVCKKLKRGEYVAAQRVIHRSLAEINFRLLHEVRLRMGEKSFREARRVEQLVSPEQLTAVSVDARLDAVSLQQAADGCAASFCGLMRQLVGEVWRWPDERR